jgi:hypothetical protein
MIIALSQRTFLRITPQNGTVSFYKEVRRGQDDPSSD